MDVAIEIGHTPASGGASHNQTHITEYDLCSTLARAVAHRLNTETTIRTQVVGRDWTDPKGENLPEKINNLGVDAVAAMHFNAFKGDATGAETLYWASSADGRNFAQKLVDRFSEALDNQNRGATGRNWSSQNTRGVRFLADTEPVYVICEPGFIDDELHKVQERFPALVEAYVEGIRGYARRA